MISTNLLWIFIICSQWMLYNGTVLLAIKDTTGVVGYYIE